jgi:DNA recombination-dependent growth factor C
VWNNATDNLQLSLSALVRALGDLYATERNNALDLTIEMSRWLKSEGSTAGFNLAEFEPALQTLSPQLERAYLRAAPAYRG